jgi:mannose-6-phosphate isomerase
MTAFALVIACYRSAAVTVVQLSRKRVAKVWGRHDVSEMFRSETGGEEPIGEIWFEHPGGRDVELLVKYLFTSDKLSIQVHPDDESARKGGYPHGKEEAWLVLDADPGAVIGVGFKDPIGKEGLRAAALDGSIETLLDWRPAAPGDVYYLKAGTVHALGAGLTIIEIQQNVDLTYRLYDYGRARELHLDEGIAAARPTTYRPPMSPYRRGDGREILVAGGTFVLERWSQPVSAGLRPQAHRPVWLAMIEGTGQIDGQALEPGTVWIADADVPIALEPGSELLSAYPGGGVENALLG